MSLQKPRLMTPSAHQVKRLVTLSSDFSVELDTLLTQRMVGFGLPGSGKTNLVALLAEQIGQYFIPMVVFCYEGDFLSLVPVLPRGVLATADNCPTGRDILQYGLQVVVDLTSWTTTDTAAQAMCDLLMQLMTYADSWPASERVPCPVFLDEAHKWLPERRGTFLSDEMYKLLQDRFSDLGSRGRKRGLMPALFAQRISLLNKAVMFPGVYFLLQQTMHADLAMYLEYISPLTLTDIPLSEKQAKAFIAAFPRGRAVVKLPNGVQKTISLNARKSEHLSHTPTAQAAINRYADMPLPTLSFGAYLPADEMVDADPQTPTKKTARRKKVAAKKPPTAADRCSALLRVNPDLRTGELAREAQCDVGTASRARAAFFALSSEAQH